MWEMKNGVEVYAIESLREYIVDNDIEIKSKEDLINVFAKMKKSGYLFRPKFNNKEKEYNKTLDNFAEAFEKDSSIMDTLIQYSANKTLEAMKQNNKKR